MWNDIKDEKTLEEFMESMDFFHDSCMKEMKYVKEINRKKGNGYERKICTNSL